MSTLTFNDSELQEEYDKFIKNQNIKPNLKFEDSEPVNVSQARSERDFERF